MRGPRSPMHVIHGHKAPLNRDQVSNWMQAKISPPTAEAQVPTTMPHSDQTDPKHHRWPRWVPILCYALLPMTQLYPHRISIVRLWYASSNWGSLICPAPPTCLPPLPFYVDVSMVSMKVSTCPWKSLCHQYQCLVWVLCPMWGPDVASLHTVVN